MHVAILLVKVNVKVLIDDRGDVVFSNAIVAVLPGLGRSNVRM